VNIAFVLPVDMSATAAIGFATNSVGDFDKPVVYENGQKFEPRIQGIETSRCSLYTSIDKLISPELNNLIPLGF